MTFLNIEGLGAAKESEVAPEGEYDLRVVSLEENQSKKSGKPKLQAMITIEGEQEDYQPIFLHMMLPEPDGEYNNLRLRDIKRFCMLFSIPFEADGFNLDDAAGATAHGRVTVEENDKGEPQNSIILPRLEDEDDDKPKGRRRRAA